MSNFELIQQKAGRKYYPHPLETDIALCVAIIAFPGKPFDGKIQTKSVRSLHTLSIICRKIVLVIATNIT